jgi:hypothetical protein
MNLKLTLNYCMCIANLNTSEIENDMLVESERAVFVPPFESDELYSY